MPPKKKATADRTIDGLPTALEPFLDLAIAEHADDERVASEVTAFLLEAYNRPVEANDGAIDRFIGSALHYRAAVASGDPRQISYAATSMVEAIKGVQSEIRLTRGQAIMDLRSEGLLWREVQEIVGVNRARLDQIVKGITGGRYDLQRARVENGKVVPKD